MRATKVQEDKEQEEYEIKAKAVMEMIRQGNKFN
jgi:hypothetical protein